MFRLLVNTNTKGAHITMVHLEAGQMKNTNGFNFLTRNDVMMGSINPSRSIKTSGNVEPNNSGVSAAVQII